MNIRLLRKRRAQDIIFSDLNQISGLKYLSHFSFDSVVHDTDLLALK